MRQESREIESAKTSRAIERLSVLAKVEIEVEDACRVTDSVV